MTLLDRLARAICCRDGCCYPDSCCANSTCPDAQAALKVVCDALRKPDEEMLDAAFNGYLTASIHSSRQNQADAILRALADHLQGEGE